MKRNRTDRMSLLQCCPPRTRQRGPRASAEHKPSFTAVKITTPSGPPSIKRRRGNNARYVAPERSQADSYRTKLSFTLPENIIPIQALCIGRQSTESTTDFTYDGRKRRRRRKSIEFPPQLYVRVVAAQQLIRNQTQVYETKINRASLSNSRTGYCCAG